MRAGNILYLIGCGAGVVHRIDETIRAAQHAGWDVHLALTETASKIVERRHFEKARAPHEQLAVVNLQSQGLSPALEELEALTGHSVVGNWTCDLKPTWAEDPADAVLIAPLTLSSLGQLATGTGKDLIHSYMNEVGGLGIPVAATVVLTTAQHAHPAFEEHLEKVSRMGIGVEVMQFPVGRPDLAVHWNPASPVALLDRVIKTRADQEEAASERRSWAAEAAAFGIPPEYFAAAEPHRGIPSKDITPFGLPAVPQSGYKRSL